MNNMPVWYFPVCYFAFGLCFGSFLNVVALRGLSGEDMVFTRSKCPKCGNQLKWYMNIPLLSYIFLRGKCGFCKTKISIQYPVVELLTALFFLFIYFKFGLTVKSLFMCGYAFFFILLALTDILETVILDYHAYILTILGLIGAYLGYNDITLVQAIIGGISGFIIFEILSRIGLLFANVRMFGEGDSFIALALGSIFGLKTLLILIALSFLVQTITAIPVLIINSFKDKKYKLGLTYIFVIFSIVLVGAINLFNLIENPIHYIVAVILITILLLISLKNILEEVKEKKKLFEKTDSIEEIAEKSQLHIMPFGPALIISAFICMFYLTEIKELISKFIY